MPPAYTFNLYRNYTATDTVVETYKEGVAYIDAPEPSTLGWVAQPGYTFKEWNSSRDGSGIHRSPGVALSAGDWYAIWESNPVPYITTDTELKSVADAIRTKGGTSSSLTYPAGFVSAVNAIPTGITPTGTLSVTSNGTYNVTNYASADVNVPTGITPTGTLSITSNGTYNVTNYASASVNVSGSGGGLQTCTLTLADGSVTCSGYSDHTPSEPYLVIAEMLGGQYSSPLIYFSGLDNYGKALFVADTTNATGWFGYVFSPDGGAWLIGGEVEADSYSTGIFDTFSGEWSAVVYELW